VGNFEEVIHIQGRQFHRKTSGGSVVNFEEVIHTILPPVLAQRSCRTDLGLYSRSLLKLDFQKISDIYIRRRKKGEKNVNNKIQLQMQKFNTQNLLTHFGGGK
jgi:hypothetical protein